MSMMEMLLGALLNPNLPEDKRFTPRDSNQFLPARLRADSLKPAGGPTLMQQFKILAKMSGGTYGNDNQ